MKLSDIAAQVINLLRSNPGKEFTATTLLLHLDLPLRQKRRIYDVVDVLEQLGHVRVRWVRRKRIFQWVETSLPGEVPTTLEIELPEDPSFQEAGTVLHTLLRFSPGAFQCLSNQVALEMLERDIKRATHAQSVSITRITLKSGQGRILKEAVHTGVLPTEAV